MINSREGTENPFRQIIPITNAIDLLTFKT